MELELETRLEGEAETAPLPPEVVRGEIRDFLRSHESRRSQIPRAMLVGAAAGLLAVAFRAALDRAEWLRNALVEYSRGHGLLGAALPILFGAITAALAVYLVRRIAPEASGSGIPHLKAVLHHLRRMRGWRILPVKFLGGALGIAGGLALGREGPTVQMGGAIGQLVGEWLRTTPRERRTLIAAGAGAGLAAAFNAPLAGVVFVLEEVQRDFTPGVFTAAFIASVTADILARLLLGQLPVFHIAPLPPPPLSALPLFLVLGVLAGGLGVFFNRALLMSSDLLQRSHRLPGWLVAALVGALVGAVAWLRPDVVAGGHLLMERTLSGQETLPALGALFMLRFVLTMLSYGCGAPGGIFAPLLILGAQSGLAMGTLAAKWFPRAAGSPVAFAVVGMGAYFTGVVRAPLTGVVLMVEMTGNYALMLPLLLACLSAFGAAELLGDRPIYEALLERDLLRGGGEVPESGDPLLLEITVAPGAEFVDKQVRELALPEGCLLISIRRGLRDLVPTGCTKLEAGDRLTALISPRASHAATRLQEGAAV